MNQIYILVKTSNISIGYFNLHILLLPRERINLTIDDNVCEKELLNRVNFNGSTSTGDHPPHGSVYHC